MMKPRLILQAYRPGGQDANDPQFAEALALAKADPELSAWFARQQKFDAQVSREIKSLPVPPKLKDKILALENPRRQKIVELPAPAWWRNLFSFSSPVSWAMAAGIVILFQSCSFFEAAGKHGAFCRLFGADGFCGRERFKPCGC